MKFLNSLGEKILINIVCIESIEFSEKRRVRTFMASNTRQNQKESGKYGI